MVEIRKDYFTDKLSIVTSDRGARSQLRPYSDHGAKCPFCPGNEEMTPQADLVVVADGQPIDTPERLAEIVSKHAVGDTVKLSVFAGGHYRDVSVTLQAAP